MPITKKEVVATAMDAAARPARPRLEDARSSAGADPQSTDPTRMPLEIKVTPSGAGELLRIGPIEIQILEDGSLTDNRFGALASVLPAGTTGSPRHVHFMHDETFLITKGSLRFIIGDDQRDAGVGDYIVVPIGAPHTFLNVSDAPTEFYSTMTPAFYIHYFRELAELSAKGDMREESIAGIMQRYATAFA